MRLQRWIHPQFVHESCAVRHHANAAAKVVSRETFHFAAALSSAERVRISARRRRRSAPTRKQMADVPRSPHFAGPATVRQLPRRVSYAAMLLVHIKRGFFKTRFAFVGVTTFVSASRKGGNESGNGIIPQHATGPILSARPPPVLIVTCRPTDAVVVSRAGTRNLEGFVLETGKELRNFLPRTADFVSSHNRLRGPSAASPGAWLPCCQRVPAARAVLRCLPQGLQTRSQPRGTTVGA